MKTKDKQYWFCMIGGVSKEKLPAGADAILRFPVRDKFNEVFGEDEVCSSGWGIDEEKFQLLQTLSSMETKELKKLLKPKTNARRI